MKLLNNRFYTFLLKLNGIIVGKHVIIHGFPLVYKFKKSRIEIGSGTVINSSFFSNMIGLYQPTIIIARYGGEIIIGDNVGISGNTIYAWEKIIIGDRTQIGANTKIIDTDFHPLEYEKRIGRNRANSKPVVIGNDVFIGMNSIILKGSKIGNGCVIGAGAVVSGEFPDNSVIVGNPARIIKKSDIKWN